MRTRHSLLGCSLVALLILSTPLGVRAAGEPGDAGLLFLRLGMGAREAAMGGAAVASAEGAAAAYWNPSRAAFSDAPGTSVLLQQQSWLGTFDYTAAALLHNGPWGVFGLTYAGFYSEEIERYSSEAVGMPEGTFSPYDLAFGASYARALSPQFSVGAQAKVVYEKIDIYSGTVVLFDVFGTWRVARLPGLDIGVSATNLGGQMTINEEPFDAPQTVTVGMAYSPMSGIVSDRLTVAADVGFFNDGNEKAHLGAEYRVVPELALRLGYRVNYENQGLTAGAGVFLKGVGVGYAYEDISDDALDPGHRFSLEFDF
ncbi:PorV/PorQ family protein [bacterium]|nr:PorV/PorQ family protein [bacterium]